MLTPCSSLRSSAKTSFLSAASVPTFQPGPSNSPLLPELVSATDESGSRTSGRRDDQSTLAKVFRMGWLRSFGKYSYGMYVFHQTIYHGVQSFLAARFAVKLPLGVVSGLLYSAISIGLAYLVARLSFDYFESRFLSLKRYFEPVIVTEGEVGKRRIDVYPRSAAHAHGLWAVK